MTGSAPVLLLLALFCTGLAAFYNFGGPNPPAGAPFWTGRFYIHLGWLGMAFMIAWMIWK